MVPTPVPASAKPVARALFLSKFIWITTPAVVYINDAPKPFIKHVIIETYVKTFLK